MADQLIGEIRVFGFDYAPPGWLFCDGSTLQVAGHEGLFGVIGTSFGHDGQATFKLPDLRGRGVVGPVLNGAPNVERGQSTVGMNIAAMPSHTHTLHASANKTVSELPGGHLPGKKSGTIASNSYIPVEPPPTLTALAPSSLAVAGSGVARENCQPYLGMTFCIALDGEWPDKP